MAIYWRIEQEEAVENYIFSGTTSEERNDIFNKYLDQPLKTMTESIIRRYNLYVDNIDYQDLHDDTISYVLLQIFKFKPNSVSKKTGKTTKAFSYIQTIIKNKLLADRMKESKKTNRFVFFENFYQTFKDDDTHSYIIDDHHKENMEELLNNIVIKIKKELNNPKITAHEKSVGLALIQLITYSDDIINDNNNKLNKNIVLRFVREYTFLETKHIRKALKRYNSIYFNLKNFMIENDKL